MRIRLAALALASLTFSVRATETVWPPLTKESLIGVWEAIFPDRTHLLHMEIRKQGDSYLTWVTLGYDCSCWHLVESDVRKGVVKLHFGKPCGGESAKSIPDLWIIGTGTGINSFGEIDAQFCGTSWPDSPPRRMQLPSVADSNHILFRKGNWTRDYTAASETAEKKIREVIASER